MSYYSFLLYFRKARLTEIIPRSRSSWQKMILMRSKSTININYSAGSICLILWLIFFEHFQTMLIDNLIHLYSESFRCGVFFAGKKYRDKPFQKLFILPKRFSINTSYVNVDENNDVDHSEDRPKRYSSDASCPINNPYGTADVPSVHNDTCFHIVSQYFYVEE